MSKDDVTWPKFKSREQSLSHVSKVELTWVGKIKYCQKCSREPAATFSTLVQSMYSVHTQIYPFLNRVNSIGIRLYLPFSDWFRTKWNSVWLEINRSMVNKIWFKLIYQDSEKNSLWVTHQNIIQKTTRWNY